MYLRSLHNVVPSDSFTQPECWDCFVETPAYDRLSARAISLLDRILHGDSGIDKRHFAIADFARLFELDAEALNHEFEFHAPALSATALSGALEKAGLHADDLDALFVCTCTGYLCPGISSHVAEKLGMSPHAFLQDIVGLGCGAALPTLRTVDGFIAAHPDAKVACVAVEICSSAFFADNDPGVLISLCLFSDGASASIWNGEARQALLEVGNFDTVHRPEDRELLRFTNAGGKLRNKLHKSVPEHAAAAVSELFQRSGVNGHTTIVSHSGGRDVIEAIERTLKRGPIENSHSVLRQYGNMSSPSVLFALEKALEKGSGDYWLTSFGAGFAAHSCLAHS